MDFVVRLILGIFIFRKLISIAFSPIICLFLIKKWNEDSFGSVKKDLFLFLVDYVINLKFAFLENYLSGLNWMAKIITHVCINIAYFNDKRGCHIENFAYFSLKVCFLCSMCMALMHLYWKMMKKMVDSKQFIVCPT